MYAFEHALRATQGARDYQEDTAAFWPGTNGSLPGPTAQTKSAEEANGDELVAVLADGMGGHAGGALASRMVCEAFLTSFASSEGDYRDRLMQALSASNSAVAEKVSENPMLSGMGSTLIGTIFGPDGLQWVSVGDSPLYLWRRGEIALLNEDHSLAPELDRLAAAGRMTSEDARRDPRRHMLRSAVTGDELDLVDLSGKPLVLEPGDYVILASDGLQTLEPNEIERVIKAYASDGAEAVASALVRAVEAIRDPHQDNATIMAITPRENSAQDA